MRKDLWNSGGRKEEVEEFESKIKERRRSVQSPDEERGEEKKMWRREGLAL